MVDFKKLVFVGIDPHKDFHVAVMINHWGQEFMSIRFANKPAGFQELIEQIRASTPPDRVTVFGIEDTGGLGRACAQWLVTQDYLVKGINPVFSSDRRKRQPHPDKTDMQDALAVAQVLVSEFDSLPVVEEDSYYRALRELSHHRDQLVKNRTRCKNQLHKLIHDNYPDYKQFFSCPFGKTALEFWHKHPHPSCLKNVGTKRLGAFLRQHSRNLSDERAQHILSFIDKTQPLSVEAKIRATLIEQLVEQLWQLNQHIEEMESLISNILAESPTHLTTMPGVGDVTAAKLIGRVGPITRFKSADQLARHAGIAPEEKSSGCLRRQGRSKSGDRQLNAAIHQIALNQISVTRNGKPRCPVAYEYYQRKVSEGKTKLSALTCLKRRLCDIIFAMLRDQTPYKMPQPVTPVEYHTAVA